MQTQPDVQEYGRVFSWTFILVCNIVGILMWILCTTDVPVNAVADGLMSRASSAYRSTFQLLGDCLEVFAEGVGMLSRS
jgi:hypothetical protein